MIVFRGLFLYCACSCLSLQAYIVRVDKLTEPASKNVPTHSVSLFGDIHGEPAQDAIQIVAFVDGFKRCSHEKTLFVEEPCFTDWFAQTPTLLAGLKGVAQQFPTVHYTNCEIRCRSNAAQYIYSTDLPELIMPEQIFRDANSQIEVGQVSVSDLFNEYDQYTSQFTHWISTLPCSMHTAFADLIERRNDDLDRLKAILQDIGHDNLLDHAKDESQQERSFITALIRNLFSRVFELHLAQKLLEPTNPGPSLAVVGGQHADLVRTLLLKLGYSLKKSDYHRGSSLPLEPKVLKKLI